MSTKATTRILFGLSVLVLIVTAVAITALLRGESTRNVVEKSPCTADPASKECQQVKRESDRERTVRDSCIPFKKVLTRRAYFKITRCPIEGVVAQSSPSASQISGPDLRRSGNDVVPEITEQPDSWNKPSEPSQPLKPIEPVTPSEPTSPAPPPVVPEPSKPLIDLTPITDPVCVVTRPLAAIC